MRASTAEGEKHPSSCQGVIALQGERGGCCAKKGHQASPDGASPIQLVLFPAATGAVPAILKRRVTSAPTSLNAYSLARHNICPTLPEEERGGSNLAAPLAGQDQHTGPGKLVLFWQEVLPLAGHHLQVCPSRA